MANLNATNQLAASSDGLDHDSSSPSKLRLIQLTERLSSLQFGGGDRQQVWKAAFEAKLKDLDSHVDSFQQADDTKFKVHPDMKQQ